MKQVIYYTTIDGKCPYKDWYKKLDKSVRQQVDRRIDRLEEGNYGDYKKISNDLFELRFKIGSGYRMYFTEAQDVIILILCAGDKSSQSKDIAKAKTIINEIKE